MAEVTMNTTIIQKHGLASAWTRVNPVLEKGQMGVETDTNKFKFGDGTTAWNDLPYAGIAEKLETARSISIDGDVEATGVAFDGSKNITLNAILKSITTAGTGGKVTVNEKGLVTKVEELSASDIEGLGTAASRDVGTSAGNVVVVSEDGKIDGSLMPSIAISDTYEVDSQTAMLALTAQVGDIAVRSDENKTYILKAEPASQLSNWVLLKTPTDAVLSVNGKTGVVTLTTSDIAEGTNLYYTEARAAASFETNFKNAASTDLKDGATLLRTTDTIILDGGEVV